jgi:hypothetical protein
MNATSEYIDSNHTGTGKHPTPSEKAWLTAKERAIAEHEARKAENSARWHAQKQEMIRALCDVHLSHGASRLFCLLCHAGWEKEFGGLYRDQVGSIDIDARRLARLCGGASVNVLYRKTRLEKRNRSGKKVIKRASETAGWLEELVRGGYLWISKKRIGNIQPYRWPNIYNLCVHVPQQITPSLPWRDGLLESANVVQESCSPAENMILAGQNLPGDGESPENTMVRHRNGGRPVTGTEDGPSPERRMGHHRNGGWAITGTEDGPSPERRMGHHRNGGRPVTGTEDGPEADPVILREVVGSNPLIDRTPGSTPPADPAFEKWIKTLDRMLPSGLEKTLTRLDIQLRQARTGEAKAELQRRIAEIVTRLDGPPVADTPKPKPAVKTAEAKPLTEEELLEGARYLIAEKKTHLLSKEQKQLLKRAGEAVR